jgi:hypothetical protein
MGVGGTEQFMVKKLMRFDVPGAYQQQADGKTFLSLLNEGDLP